MDLMQFDSLLTILKSHSIYIEAGTASIEGDEKALDTVIGSFDQVSSNKPEPHDLHN